jgi:hypothetical protein
MLELAPNPPPHPASHYGQNVHLPYLSLSRSYPCVARRRFSILDDRRGGLEPNPAAGPPLLSTLQNVWEKELVPATQARSTLTTGRSNAAAARLLPLNLSSLGSWERGGGGDLSCIWFRGHHHAEHTHQHTPHACCKEPAADIDSIAFCTTPIINEILLQTLTKRWIISHLSKKLAFY